MTDDDTKHDANERIELVARSRARWGNGTGSVGGIGGDGTYNRTRSTYTLTFMIQSCCRVAQRSIRETKK